ncbi:hypothetical protein EDC04DRAFT_2685024 [Pisolithus marmoratus]|nr:hypothetical protein EDC04DRAFT_2685024 [Pisolithus marmoratus]
MEKWCNSRFLETWVHPEISIILHLSSAPLSPWAFQRLRPMGCSRRACMCCTVWIATYNLFSPPGWLMSRTDGKADATWALPGRSNANAIVNINGEIVTDAAVWRAVEKHMTHSLQTLFPVSAMETTPAFPICFEEKQGLMKRIMKQF